MGFQPMSTLVKFKPYSLYKSTVNDTRHKSYQHYDRHSKNW